MNATTHNLQKISTTQNSFYRLFFILSFVLMTLESRAQNICNIEQLQRRETTGMLFAVKENKQILAYLFGSIHIGYEPIKKLPKPVEVALSQSKKYYVEWHPDDDKKSRQEADLIFPDKGVRNLKTVLNAENYKILSAHLDQLNMSPEARASAESLHPNKLIPDLIDPDPPELKKSTPLDHLLLMSVLMHGQELGGIETTQEHWLPIAAITTDEQINLLAAESLKELSCNTCRKGRAQLSLCTLELTRLGEADQLVAILEKFNDSRPIAKAHMGTVVNARNAGMTKKIASLLRKEPTFFVNIGSLHLGGKLGVLQGLRDLGYTVEKVTE